jgi:hypothetical protein
VSSPAFGTDDLFVCRFANNAVVMVSGGIGTEPGGERPIRPDLHRAQRTRIDARAEFLFVGGVVRHVHGSRHG